MRQGPEKVAPARLAFQGTVQSVNHQEATVRVDTPVAGLPAGRRVQVRLAKGERITPGETVIFDVSGWEVGESVVLLSLGHHPPSKAGRIAHQRADARRTPGADVVVSGTVRRVAPAPEAARSYITEHDPKWHDAVVKVTGTLEGVPPGEEVVVRFPASDDVAFHSAPKLSPGQTGTFMLKREATKSGRTVYKAVGVRDLYEGSRSSKAPARRKRASRPPR